MRGFEPDARARLTDKWKHGNRKPNPPWPPSGKAHRSCGRASWTGSIEDGWIVFLSRGTSGASSKHNISPVFPTILMKEDFRPASFNCWESTGARGPRTVIVGTA